MGIDAALVPIELRRLNQWVLWRLENDTKKPYQASGKLASSTDPSTWTTFPRAMTAYQTGKFSGVGFVFAEGGGLLGIDLDGCRNPDTGELASWAEVIIHQIPTYAEVSPSGTGIKLFLQGKLPWPTGRHEKLPKEPSVCDKAPAIEAYDHGRYFAVTSQIIDGAKYSVERCDEALDLLIRCFFPDQAPAAQPSDWQSDAAVVERARVYVSKLPPAVSGQGGHAQTYRAACVLARGFGLPEGDCMNLIREYSARCVPPWSEKELAHKVKSAMAEGGNLNYLRNAKPAHWDKIPVPEYKLPEPSELPSLASAVERVVQISEAGKGALVRTLLPGVDRAIGGGYSPGEMIVLAARPSHGKSLVALQVCHNLTHQGIPCLFVSQEMGELAIGKRTAQYLSDVPEHLWATQGDRVRADLDKYSANRAQCYLAESPGSVDRAVEIMRRCHGELGVQFAAVDYLQLLQARGKDRYHQVTEVCQRLRQAANEIGITLLVLAQLSRGIEHRAKFIPMLSDLKESGQIEQDADVILFLCWPAKLDKKRDPYEYTIFVAKNRNRPIRDEVVMCRIDPAKQMIREEV